MHPDRDSTTGVVLAGGRARRMGGEDKGLIEFRGKPLVVYALEAIRVIADRVLISANRNRERYASFGYPIIADPTPTFEGPLAGLLSAMKAAETPYLLVVPCDSPMMTGTLLGRLVAALTAEKAAIAVAHDGERLHPVFMLVQRQLADDLEQFLSGNERKLERWLARHCVAVAHYGDRPDVFVNVNTPAELSELEARLVGRKSS